jgi:signal peptidase I
VRRVDLRFVIALTVILIAAVALVVLLTRHVATPWTVAGPSMEPTLRDGDRVIVDLRTYRRRLPRVGEIVLLEGPSGAPMVKRVAERVAGTGGAGGEEIRFRVLGDNPGSSDDSRSFGPVPAQRLRGRIVFRYWPPSGFGPIE